MRLRCPESASRTSPESEFGWHGAPFGSVLMPPEKGRNGAAQILWQRLALRPAGFHQQLKPQPIAHPTASLLLAQEGPNLRPSKQFKRSQAVAGCCSLPVAFLRQSGIRSGDGRE